MFACSVQNFAKDVINLDEFPKKSRILQKLKPKNSISGISKIFCYPECGQKKAALITTYFKESNLKNLHQSESGSKSYHGEQNQGYHVKKGSLKTSSVTLFANGRIACASKLSHFLVG